MAISNSDIRDRLWDDPLALSTGETLVQTAMRSGRFSNTQAVTLVKEYRRFLYLAATQAEVVAPSPLIDEVWHRHIQDTEAYVEYFCPRVFGRLLHHRPGRPSAKRDPAYGRTLELYSRIFDEEPNPLVWPSPRRIRLTSVLPFLAALSCAMLLTGLILQSTPAAMAGVLMLFASLYAISEFAPLRWGATWMSAPDNHSGGGCSAGCGGGGGGGDGGGCGGGD